jgi:hypothetical protein
MGGSQRSVGELSLQSLSSQGAVDLQNLQQHSALLQHSALPQTSGLPQNNSTKNDIN